MNRIRAFYNIISNSFDVTDFTNFNTVKQTVNSLESLIIQLDPNAVFTHKTTADKTKVWIIVVHEENNKEYGIIVVLSREGYNISII